MIENLLKKIKKVFEYHAGEIAYPARVVDAQAFQFFLWRHIIHTFSGIRPATVVINNPELAF